MLHHSTNIVPKPDPRVCPKCGMKLKPRGNKLPGRYYCPNPEHSEGEAEYIITSEFYHDFPSGPTQGKQ
ncbi:MAG: hypothetical protein ACRDF4_04540, partial [Rhabdochlamydiaceae bacterium]